MAHAKGYDLSPALRSGWRRRNLRVSSLTGAPWCWQNAEFCSVPAPVQRLANGIVLQAPWLIVQEVLKLLSAR